MRRRLLHFLLPFLLAGCAKLITPSCDVEVEAGRQIIVSEVDGVDLLFVVDDSASMREEQASLAAAVPELLRALRTGDLDGDGVAEREGIDSIHVGVVTTDLGAGEVPLPTCERPAFGDDARLAATCEPSVPAFLAFEPGADADALAAALACRVEVGTSGCAFEQPLEAALKALSPSTRPWWAADGYVPPTFYRGTVGHGDAEHEGFLRPGSLLVVVPVSDEDDCSVADPALFDPDDPAYAGTDLNLRCAIHPEALHRVERYVDGLLGLRRYPSMVLFAPVVGIPPDLATGPAEWVEWDRLVGNEVARDPRLVERVDPDLPNRLVPSCDVPGRGQAYPPLRILRVAEALDDRGATVRPISICQDGLYPLAEEILRSFGGVSSPDCVSRGFPREPDRSLACTVELELLSGACEGIPGATAALDAAGAPRTRDGRVVCELRQLVATEADVAAGRAPAGDGWWYDEHLGPFVCAGPPSRFAFPHLPFATGIRLGCRPATWGIARLGDTCEVDEDCGPRPTRPLFDRLPPDCVGGVCRQPCADDADCVHAELLDTVCLEGACAPVACLP